MARSDLPVAAPGHAHWDTSAIEARIINGTTTKADVRWLVESVEALADHRDALLAERQQDKAEIARMREALTDLLSWQPQKDRTLAACHPQHRVAIEAARAALAVEEEGK